MFATGSNWDPWMKDYRYGALVYLPPTEVQTLVDELRARYDSWSAKISGAHATVTQPFRTEPTETEIAEIERRIGAHARFALRVGPFGSSPNGRLIWMRVEPAARISALRDELHGLDLFRTDLPFTEGFLPHLTVSEALREPAQVEAIARDLDAKHPPTEVPFDHVSWYVPDEGFVFRARREFALGVDAGASG